MTSGGLFAFSTLLLAPQNCGEPYSFFYFLAKTQRRKEIVVARYDFRRPLQPAPQNCWGLPCFAACPAELRGAKYFFLFFLRAKAQRRKEIVVQFSALDTWYFVLSTWYKSNLLSLACLPQAGLLILGTLYLVPGTSLISCFLHLASNN
jgi:hypothetical protein